MDRRIIAIAAVFVVASVAEAKIVVLGPQADVDIRSADLADNGYDRNVLWIQNGGTDPSAVHCGKAYIRFKLPADFGTASNAAVTLRRAVVGAWNWTYEVHGLDDGVAGEADWLELDGSGAGTTWNNAPGNITTSPDGFANSTLVGSFQVANADNGGAAGDSWSVGGTGLVDFLNADTNGYVTFMIGRTTSSTSSDQFASKENATYAAPELTLEYAPLPGISEVVLTPDADADIRSSGLSTNSYNRDALLVTNTGADPSVSTNAKAYIRYKLPVDIDTVLDATFTIDRASVGAWNWTYEVHGLDDGVAGETDWVESNTDGITWDTAPGNDATSPNGFTDSTLVGSFQVANAGNGGVAGDSWSISGQELIDFLGADTNGYITLMIGRTGASTSSDLFASRQNTNYLAPRLTLQYFSSLSYPRWIENYPGVGSETALTDDPDSDGLDNLGEWALGGNPDDAADRGRPPVVGTVEVGGTNWFEYVYAKRNNADILGLTYWLEQQSTGLVVAPSWTNGNYEIMGTGVLDDEFDTVTNRMPTDAEAMQFLRLRVEAE